MSSEMRMSKTTPILRIFDEATAKAFYRDFLGFAVDWEHRFEPGLPLYLQVSRGDCALHLTEHHGDACPGAAVRIQVSDVDALQAELLARRSPFSRPEAQDMPWDTRDLAVTDPFGNRLVFSSMSHS